jgi:hypothetical protein
VAHHGGHLIEDVVADRLDDRLVGLEEDLVEDLDLVRRDADLARALVGAAVLVLDAVDVLGLVGALVGDVQDAVLIVVGIGAAVGVFELVLVLGVVGALVLRVEQAVAVRVALDGLRRRRSTGTSSGQPSSSAKPLRVSGSFGQRSTASTRPSLSLSGSGQPSLSSKSSRSSGSSGQPSSSSMMPSPSRSERSPGTRRRRRRGTGARRSPG